MSTPSWVFIRGLTRGQGHWLDFRTEFEDAVGKDNVEWIDLAGNGERFREQSLTSNIENAADARGKSKFIAEGRKIILVGHSLGAMVAVEWMKQFPQDLQKIYLINTSSSNTGVPWKRFNWEMLRMIPKIAFAQSAFDKERLILSIIANNSERVSKLLPLLASYTEAHPVSPGNAVRQLFAAFRSRFPGHSSVPVEIIFAEKDRLVAAENSRRLAQRWSAKTHIHASAGHDIAVDDPKWLVEQLL